MPFLQLKCTLFVPKWNCLSFFQSRYIFVFLLLTDWTSLFFLCISLFIGIPAHIFDSVHFSMVHESMYDNFSFVSKIVQNRNLSSGISSYVYTSKKDFHSLKESHTSWILNTYVERPTYIICKRWLVVIAATLQTPLFHITLA